MKKILFTLTILSLVSCGKNEPLTQLGQGAEHLAQGIGNVGEDIGQIPRILGHQFLGTDIDSEKRLKSLESELEELKKKVNSNYISTILELNKLKDSVNNSSEENESDIAEINDTIDDLKDTLDDLLSKINFDDLSDLLDMDDLIETIQDKLQCAKNAKGLKSVQSCL
jgi:chromosome segregation ATPase